MCFACFERTLKWDVNTPGVQNSTFLSFLCGCDSIHSFPNARRASSTGRGKLDETRNETWNDYENHCEKFGGETVSIVTNKERREFLRESGGEKEKEKRDLFSSHALWAWAKQTTTTNKHRHLKRPIPAQISARSVDSRNACYGQLYTIQTLAFHDDNRFGCYNCDHSRNVRNKAHFGAKAEASWRRFLVLGRLSLRCGHFADSEANLLTLTDCGSHTSTLRVDTPALTKRLSCWIRLLSTSNCFYLLLGAINAL